MTRRRSRTTPAASTHPTPAPPAARTTNCPAPCSSTPPGVARPAGLANPNETAIWNSTRLVASLNRLSACTSACTLGGSESRRPSALTATGSVLTSTAPSTNAMLAGTAATAHVTAATAAADASTRPTARTATGRHTARRSRNGSSSLAAYNSGGSTTRLPPSGGTWTAGNLGARATTSPAITSRDGAGMRSRPAKAATTVPSTTRNKTTSTLRTRSVCTRLVAGVGGRLELEGGVLDVEVPGQAGLQLVEQAGYAALGEAGVVHHDVRRQRGQ